MIETVWFDSIDSTNEEAKRRAEAGAVGPLWLAARQQTQGRGRQGRVWQGDPNNLAVTYLATFAQPASQLANLSFVVALAVADTCDAFGVSPAAAVKWPNDIYINGAKVAGVLLESGGTSDGRIWLAMGMGINLASHPDGLDYPASHVGAHIPNAPPAPEQALVVLDEHLHRWLAVWQSQGFGPIRDAWHKRAFGLGQRATARLAGGDVSGIALGIDERGALELKQSHGEIVRIAAGEVFFV